ncbi:unnamed protein product [Prorocentrum cordatum]|uniref:Casein kinase I n=1 Tax=Prorocentrum cordatum TaxID=2364126 RepID=A0ABN9W7P7_9DINO|nr:unnamed protein product [Polarella glacialis]
MAGWRMDSRNAFVSLGQRVFVTDGQSRWYAASEDDDLLPTLGVTVATGFSRGPWMPASCSGDLRTSGGAKVQTFADLSREMPQKGGFRLTTMPQVQRCRGRFAARQVQVEGPRCPPVAVACPSGCLSPPRGRACRGGRAPAAAPGRCRAAPCRDAAAPARAAAPPARERAAHAAAPGGAVRGQSRFGCAGEVRAVALGGRGPRVGLLSSLRREGQDELLGRAVAGRFRLCRRIGSGSFGSVYSARHDRSGLEVAVKLERASAPYPQLWHEARVYEVLGEHPAVVPRVHWYGRDGDHQVLVMDLLGPSLADLHKQCGGAFSLRTSIALAEQIVSRLEELHSAGLLHRDVKPDNFCIGHGAIAGASEVYALDFGCAKSFRDPQTMRHIPEESGKCMVGTARYASLRAHMGQQLSRRDDLECVGYLLVWFLKGRLPWQGLDAISSEERMTKIAAAKAGIAAATLCGGLPREIEAYVTYCRGLGFEERPDYRRLRSLLRAAVGHEGVPRTLRLDWQPPPTDAEPRPAEAPPASPAALRRDSLARPTPEAGLAEPDPRGEAGRLPDRRAAHQVVGARAPRLGPHGVHAELLR